ncbi:MAG: hypothetical protein ABI635_04390 [Actinomycetota bacterium]
MGSPTPIIIIVLLVLIATAAVGRILFAFGGSPALVGTTSPGQPPSSSVSP